MHPGAASADADASDVDSRLPPKLRCLKCQGTDVRKFSVLFDQGRSTSSSMTKGSAVGFSGSGVGLGFGTALSAGHSASELARQVAPPEQRLFAKANFWDAKGKQRDEESFRAALDRWNHKYLCLQCATVLMVRDMNAPPELVESNDRELDELIRSGRKVQAVVHVREKFGLGVTEALKRVDARAREL